MPKVSQHSFPVVFFFFYFLFGLQNVKKSNCDEFIIAEYVYENITYVQIDQCHTYYNLEPETQVRAP